MKKQITFLVLLILTSIIYGCSSSINDSNITSGTDSINYASAEKSALLKYLTTAEKTGLIRMREEEKLARDFYITMNNKYNLRVFHNISSSEQQHMDALLNLINRYSVTDPVGVNAIGVFSDKSIQELYNKFIAKGNVSAAEALQTGIEIEQMDIKDLQEQIDILIDKTDLLRVYTNLQLASMKHLEAFTFNYDKYIK